MYKGLNWFRSSVGKGALLLVCVVLACLWRNLSSGATYETFWKLKSVGVTLPFSLRDTINNVLMTFFFFAVTLEIRKEFLHGEFKNAKKAIAPAVLGVLGMVGPALVCIAITWGTPDIRAWPIPTATDIALSLGVLALAAERVPRAMRPFMATVALVDDVGGILLVAILFTASFHAIWGLWCLVAVALAWVGFKKVNPHLGIVLLVLAAVWFCFFKAGVNAALSGVIIALLIPSRKHKGLPHHQPTYVDLYESLFSPVVNFVILPIFLLANAGADLHFGGRQIFDLRLFLGVGLGLLLGKSVSMFLAGKAIAKTRIGELPAGVNNQILAGFSFVGGVGLKMCVFIVPLAFKSEDSRSVAILGIYSGMVASAIVGTTLLHRPWSRMKAEAQAA